jgi:hypothetical protein
MDGNGVAALLQRLASKPSRRAITRSLTGLAVGPALNPLTSFLGAEAKHKGGHVQKWKRYCKAYHYLWCPVQYAHDFCCQQQPDSPAVCTECGCCYQGSSNCCLPGAKEVLDKGLPSMSAPCCGDDQTCCIGLDGVTVDCCDPNQLCCNGRCCAPEFSSQCCGGLSCCHELETCCPDGVCHLTC